MPAAVPPVAGADQDKEVTPPVPGGVWVTLSASTSPGVAQALEFPGAQSQPSATPSESLSATTHAPAWQSPHEAQVPPSPRTVTFTVAGDDEQPPIDAVTE